MCAASAALVGLGSGRDGGAIPSGEVVLSYESGHCPQQAPFPALRRCAGLPVRHGAQRLPGKRIRAVARRPRRARALGCFALRLCAARAARAAALRRALSGAVRPSSRRAQFGPPERAVCSALGERVAAASTTAAAGPAVRASAGQRRLEPLGAAAASRPLRASAAVGLPRAASGACPAGSNAGSAPGAASSAPATRKARPRPRGARSDAAARAPNAVRRRRVVQPRRPPRPRPPCVCAR